MSAEPSAVSAIDASTSLIEVSESVATEEFVMDDRAGLRPSEIVQKTLLTLLSGDSVPVSCMHLSRAVRRF